MEETCFKCFLAMESVSGTRADFLIMQNKGEFLSACNSWNMLLKAFTGHNGESPKDGMVIVAI